MMAKTPIYIINSVYHGPALGQLGCSIYGFVGGLTGTASIMTLASIALDRYYAIVHPLNPFKRTTSGRAVLMILCIWSYSAVFSSLPLFGVNNYTSEGYLTSCSFDYLSENVVYRVFVFAFFLAAWCFPLAIILFSYVNIYRMVKAAERMETFNVGNVRPTAGESFKFKPDVHRHKNEVKIAILALVLVTLWMLAWTPYACVALLGIFGKEDWITPNISALPSVFCKMSSCMNCFVYSMNHPKFQREIRSLFSPCFRRRPNKRRETAEDSYYSAVAACRENEQSIACINQPLRTSRRHISLKSRSSLVNLESDNKAQSCWKPSASQELQVKSNFQIQKFSKTGLSYDDAPKGNSYSKCQNEVKGDLGGSLAIKPTTEEDLI